MVRASRNASNLRRAAEEVIRVPAGPGPDGPEYTEVRTGRRVRPSSPEEWIQARLVHLERFRAWPAAGAVIALLEAGEDADVKAAGAGLDPWARHGVLTALGELVTSARQDYPAAVAVVERLRRAWAARWGDQEPYPPPRAQEVARTARARVPSMASDPPGADHLARAWGALEPGAGARLGGPR